VERENLRSDSSRGNEVLGGSECATVFDGSVVVVMDLSSTMGACSCELFVVLG
jgi:hypothetical protein